MNTEQARFNMIEQQIRPWDVLDPSVLSLLTLVRREDFVALAYRFMAFMDVEIPLPCHGHAREVMLSPKVEARLLQELFLHKHERVLEIGTGSGFMAALLAHRAQQVTSYEIRPELANFAAINLRKAGISNVQVLEGNGAGGAPREAPWDAILLSGSVSQVPDTLLRQLKIGGRLLAIVGEEPIMRSMRFTRTHEGSFQTEVLFDTVIPRLKGFNEAGAFRFN